MFLILGGVFVRIAIVGTGISGLTAAYYLARKFEVTLFEAQDYVGGHTHTVDVDLDGRRFAIDTGFIVFNDWTYPNFIRLLDELGVESEPTSMGFSVRCDRTGWEYSGNSLATMFAQKTNLLRPRFHRMLRDILRFNRQGKSLLNRVSDDLTVGQFLEKYSYSEPFRDQYLFPMGSAIWSCPAHKFADFPIRFILEFYVNHGLLNLRDRPTWRVISGGSRVYVEKLIAGFRDRIRLKTPIARIRRTDSAVEIAPQGNAPETFDHVILACHSDQALALLADPSPAESEVLGKFPYERNVALLHTDESLLPRHRRTWSSWNYHVSRDQPDRATLTYHMNILQNIKSNTQFLVTLNEEHAVNPARVLGRYIYHHPVYTTARAAAQARHPELIDRRRTSYCGAYWGNGFHEDGVRSALRVCEALCGGAV